MWCDLMIERWCVCTWQLKPNGFEMNFKWNSFVFDTKASQKPYTTQDIFFPHLSPLLPSLHLHAISIFLRQWTAVKHKGNLREESVFYGKTRVLAHSEFNAKVIGKLTHEPGIHSVKLGASKLEVKGRQTLFTAAHFTPKQWRNSIFVAQIVAQPIDVSIPHFRRCIHLWFMLEFWSWDLEKLQQWHQELRLKAWKSLG